MVEHRQLGRGQQALRYRQSIVRFHTSFTHNRKAASNRGLFHYDRLRMRSLCIFVAIGLMLPSSSKDPRSNAPAKYSTSSKIMPAKDGDTPFSVVDNGRFYVDPEYRIDSGKAVDLIIEEHILSEIRTDRECCSSKITVKGRIDGKVGWTATKEANRGEMFERFYRTVSAGCCGARTRYAYFDPLSGAEAFIATEPLASLAVVGSYNLTRYLALNEASEADEPYVLQIQYGPQSGSLQTVYLTATASDITTFPITVRFLKDGKFENSTITSQEGIYPREFTLFPHNYPTNRQTSIADITNISFVITVGNRGTVQIPVSSDRLNLKAATAPSGFHLTDTIPDGFAPRLKAMKR